VSPYIRFRALFAAKPHHGRDVAQQAHAQFHEESYREYDLFQHCEHKAAKVKLLLCYNHIDRRAAAHDQALSATRSDHVVALVLLLFQLHQQVADKWLFQALTPFLSA
jgi:hypothetical protein